MGSVKALSLEGRLVWMWRTRGDGVVTRKWVGGGRSIFGWKGAGCERIGFEDGV